MILARIVLLLSALPFLAIGVAFLLDPGGMAAHVGLSLRGTIADSDVRAVYGGLQIACGALLGLGCVAVRHASVRAALRVQILLFAGLAGARLFSLVRVGSPGELGWKLLAAEAVGLLFGVAAQRRLRARDPHALA